MRIYYAITKSGGKIAGSSEAGEIYQNETDIEDYFIRFHEITGKKVIWDDSLDYDENSNPYIPKNLDFISYDEFIKWGYDEDNPPSYAIEIRDFRPEELTFGDFKAAGWHNGELLIFKYCVNKMAGTFRYGSINGNGISILMPITQAHFDMIASGEKRYIFMRRLPKALREGTK
jgi:hypothetical protein